MNFSLFDLEEYANSTVPKTEEAFDDYSDLILPKSDADAAAAYDRFKKKDPFPDIAPALLNSADIFKYVAATGLIYPFHIDNLRGADYKVLIKGRCIFWDAKGNKVERDLQDKSDKVILPPNSISYVTLEPIFRVPIYMILRFNLKVSHAYKGLLLGTGPIVDPGFYGKICIPLHNLTANEYRFNASEELISMEFTKLSYNPAWFNDCDSRIEIHGYYRENREFKYDSKEIYPELNVTKALKEQNSDNIISSIHKVTEKAEEALEESRNAKKHANWVAIIAIVTMFVSLFGILYSSYSLIDNTKNYWNDKNIETFKELQTLKEKDKQQDEMIKSQQVLIEQLTNKSEVESEPKTKN